MRFQKGKERNTMLGQFGYSSRWLFAAVAVLACLSLIPTASAAAVGAFNESSCSGGGVTVTATLISWSPGGTVSNSGCIDTGILTSLTYSGGTLGSGVVGNIMNVPFGGGSINDFMTFQGTTLDFVLTNVGPGVANTICTGLSMGASCSVTAGSPFILTALSGGDTTASLSVAGTITDGGVLSYWQGSFSTQLNETADSIQSTFLANGTFSSAQSGQFNVSIVPEPASMTLLGAGLIAIALAARKRRTRV
jgi:hypothetical protein